jgi:Tfp pilus assembly protein PilF
MDANTMYLTGNYWSLHGDDAKAERWWRKAAADGQTDAMNNLGNLLYQQGKEAEAEQWLRKAAAAGEPNAMHDLGLLLSRQGQAAEAEQWLRKAAEAEQWLRKAAEAEQSLRKAAMTGDANAMHDLGMLLSRQGQEAEAEQWLRKAAKTEQSLRKAAMTGDANAMHDLGMLLSRQGKKAEGEQWLYKASTDPAAMTEAGRGYRRLSKTMLAVIIALIGAIATIVAAVIGHMGSSSNNSNIATSSPIHLSIKSVSFSVHNGKVELIVSGIYDAEQSDEYIYAIARPSKVPSGTASWLASEPVPANNGPWTADITLTTAESNQRMTVFAVLAGGCLPRPEVVRPRRARLAMAGCPFPGRSARRGAVRPMAGRED